MNIARSCARILRCSFLLLCAAVALACCAHEIPATPDEKDAASLRFVKCMRANIIALDDSHSDAASVAGAVSLLCESEYSQMLQVRSSGMSDLEKRGFYERAKADRQNLFISFVLRYRQEHPSSSR